MPKTVRRRTGRPRSPCPDNEEKLLRAARDLFSARNYSTVTLKDIGRAAGVNPALIHYYFASKEELFLRMVEATATTAFNTFQMIRHDAVEPCEVIALWIENHILQFPLMQKLLQLSLDYATTHAHAARIDAAIQKFYRMESEVLGEALRRGMDDGLFQHRDVDSTVVFISTFLDGALVRDLLLPQEFEPAAAIHALRKVVFHYLRFDAAPDADHDDAPRQPCQK